MLKDAHHAENPIGIEEIEKLYKSLYKMRRITGRIE